MGVINQMVWDREWSDAIVPELLRRDSAPLQLFVAGDVDGLCALHLVEHSLSFDHITWEATPVLSYDDLTTSLLSSFAFTRLSHTSTHPARYLLLNCGANVDLVQLLQLDDPSHDHVLLYVIDSHRPLHYNNCHQATLNVQVIVSHDDIKALPPLEDEDSDSEGEEDDETPPALARRRAREEVRDRNRQKLKDYYSECYYSTPVSMVAFDWCARLDRQSPLALWWSIVGLTDAFIHERIGGGQYDTWVQQLHEALDRYNVTNEPNTFYDHPLFPSASSPPTRAQSSGGEDGTSSTAPNIPMPAHTAIGHITFTRHELRLLHLRHLPLLDSMQWSPYLSAQLRRWNDRGIGHIRTVLVQLGIPLHKARQQWMEEEMQWRLREGMDALLFTHRRLKDIRMASFYRQYTPTLTLSAVDAVYIAAALLEQDRTPPPSLSDSSRPSKRLRREDEGNAGNSSKLCPEFWDAYRAIGCTELPVLMRGLHSSIHLLQISNQTGLDLMKKHLVRRQGPIRYAVLSEGPQLSTLAHPLILHRLAMFLYDCQRQVQQKKAATSQNGGKGMGLKPLVVACLAPDRGVYVVVGVQSTLGEALVGGVGEPEKSRMASAFRNSAMGVGILDEVRHDSFDGSTMEVPKGKWHRFLEYLSVIPAW